MEEEKGVRCRILLDSEEVKPEDDESGLAPDVRGAHGADRLSMVSEIDSTMWAEEDLIELIRVLLHRHAYHEIDVDKCVATSTDVLEVEMKSGQLFIICVEDVS